MKRNNIKTICATGALILMMACPQADKLGYTRTFEAKDKYLLIPIEDQADENTVQMYVEGNRKQSSITSRRQPYRRADDHSHRPKQNRLLGAY